MRTISTPTNRDVKPTYIQFDTLDDRREIFHLLAKLSPLRRVRFLQWFLSQQRLGPWPSIKMVVTRDTVELAHLAMRDDSADARLNHHVFGDIWSAASSCEGLSLDMAFNALTRLVKKTT